MIAAVALVRLRGERPAGSGELLGFLGSLFDHVPDVLGGASAGGCGVGYPVEDSRAGGARFGFLLGGGERFVFGGDR